MTYPRFAAVATGLGLAVLVALAAWMSDRGEPVLSPASADATASGAADSSASASRNPKWAAPMEIPGVPNLHKVSDTQYRGAQPTARGMQELTKLGVKTVVNLRTLHSDRDEIGETGLQYEHIYFNPFNPETEEVVRFLQIATDPDRTPVYVHCMQGVDRTGTMSAIYRIVVQGWSKADAVEEMTGGYEMHRNLYANLIEFIRDLDVEAIRRRAGLEK